MLTQIYSHYNVNDVNYIRVNKSAKHLQSDENISLYSILCMAKVIVNNELFTFFTVSAQCKRYSECEHQHSDNNEDVLFILQCMPKYLKVILSCKRYQQAS